MRLTAWAILVGLVETAQTKGWEYLLTNPQTGTRYKDLKRVWISVLKDAEIEDLTLHSLRHTFITRAIDSAAPITGVRDAVGHKSLATTNQYAHATEEGKR
jgi:integrase